MEFKVGDIAIIDLRGDPLKFINEFRKYDGDLVEIVDIVDDDFCSLAKIRLPNGDYFDLGEYKRDCLIHNVEYLRHANTIELEEFDSDEGVIL